MTANLFSLSYRVPAITQAGLCAGMLLLINMIPLFAELHLGFLTDLLSVHMITYYLLYHSAGLISFIFVLFHILVMLD